LENPLSLRATTSKRNEAMPVTEPRRDEPSFRSLHDDIYLSLRKALMSGGLVPGQAVSIRSLAQQFGTSVIPVRDALRRLVAERGLSLLPNRTVMVSRMTRHRYQEILNVRLSIEPMLARKATELISTAEIAGLELINDEMQAAVGRDNVKQYLLANQRFHFGLYAAAHSMVMLPIVESLWMQVGPFMHAVFTASGTRNARDSHAEVLKALRRRDSLAVANAIARDLGDAADVVLARTEFEAE
jgi:DNA-binding GntR family transcriptional regulator